MQIVGYLIVLVIALIIIAVVLYFAVLIVAGTLAILCLVAVAVYGPKVAVWVRAEHFKRKGGWAGTPDIALDRWNWQNGPTCAINAQRVILSLFGVDKSEAELAGRQQAYGRYSKKKGTSDVSFVLEGYGLKVRRKSKKSRWFFSEMWSGLRSGRLYILTVNSFVLNSPDERFSAKRGPVADHAIVLTAVESVEGKLFAYYTDSGAHDGSLKRISLGALLDSVDDLVVETPKTPKHKAECNPTPLSHKVVACLGCRKRLRIPFGRTLKVTCPTCGAAFLV